MSRKFIGVAVSALAILTATAALASLFIPTEAARIDASSSPQSGEPSLADIRRATEKYRDIKVALADGYIRDPANMCETADMMGLPREQGAMGIHYFRPDLLGINAPPNPRVSGAGTHTDFLKPAILLYEPQADGSLTLIGVENLVFAKAWKDKDHNSIQSLYRRSSLTLLIFATFLFMMVWLNLDSVFAILHIPELYLQGRYVILFLGLSKVLDLGTGVNEQIIGTSNMWRFQFYLTLVLLAGTVPMNIWLIKWLGITGSGVAALVMAVVYNSLRYAFLYFRFGMQPFTLRTLYVVLLAVLGWSVCQFLITMENPWVRGILRTGIFCAIYLFPIIYFRWSQDVTESWR